MGSQDRCTVAEDTGHACHGSPHGEIWGLTRRSITPNICLLTFFLQEDPRLKFPVHMRSKASLNPNDLGPLPVSTLETHGPVWKCLLVHGPSVDREALWPSLSPDVLNPLGLSFLNRIGCMTELIAHSVHTTPSSSERGFWMADC